MKNNENLITYLNTEILSKNSKAQFYLISAEEFIPNDNETKSTYKKLIGVFDSLNNGLFKVYNLIINNPDDINFKDENNVIKPLKFSENLFNNESNLIEELFHLIDHEILAYNLVHRLYNFAINRELKNPYLSKSMTLIQESEKAVRYLFKEIFDFKRIELENRASK
ncbi:hypothetical protein T190115A13A_160008 [Tenacibaculum sp. 190524A02b]|uniref:DUF892 family protein n=1 Tax=Tenacibaculum vairaonense TaxID=3137860 RepID=A0ABP1F4U6_9FLAO